MKTQANIGGVRYACQELNKCEQTIKKWADDGTLPSRRDMSGRRIFSADDIAALKAKLAVKASRK